MRDFFWAMVSHAYQHLDWRSRILVVMLHRVGVPGAVSQERVRRQLAFVAEHYEVICPSQLDQAQGRKRLAMVTIDDGHADAYSHVYPVAKALGIPIVLCPSTDFLLREQWLWFNRFDWAIGRGRTGAECRVGPNRLLVGDTQSVAAFRRWLKTLEPLRREAVLDEVLNAFQTVPPPNPPEEYRPVNQQELQEMLASGLMELCSHTVTHTSATALADADLHDELARSRRELAELAGKEIVAFCYPNYDFDERTDAAVRKAGFKMAFTAVEGMNGGAGTDPYKFRRIHVHRRDAVFLKQASGLGDLKRLIGLDRSQD